MISLNLLRNEKFQVSLLLTIKKIKTALRDPRPAFAYILRVLNYDRYLYNAMKRHNEKNSKYTLYFDFCKRILTDTISNESLRNAFFNNPEQISESEINSALEGRVGIQDLVGDYWPKRAHTMIGLMRLENLQFCVEDVLKNNIEGDLIETGVWRGGAAIFMRLILKKYGIRDKIVYVADSFEGLLKPDVAKYPVDAGDMLHTFDALSVSLEEVQNNFKAYGVLNDQVKFLKGWFKDTTKQPPFEKLSILRLDGDMYSSTWEVLENLYDKLSPGGYLIIDDYVLRGCRAAVNDFRLQNNIKEPLVQIDWTGVYWKKDPNEVNQCNERQHDG